MILSSLFVSALLGVVSANSGAGLFGMSPRVNLIEINSTSAAITNVSRPISNEGQAQELSAINSKTGVYYIVGYDALEHKPNLVGLSTISGTVVSKVDLPFSESVFVGVGQSVDVDPETGHVYVGGRMEPKGPHTVISIHPGTGDYKLIAKFDPTYLSVLDGPSAYDPKTQSLILQLGKNDSIVIVSVDVTTGQVSEFAQDPEDGRTISTMDYDTKSGLIYGLGIKPKGASIERSMVTLDPKEKAINTVGYVPDYTIESGDIAALNEKDRILYWIGQKTGANSTAPFYLVELDLSDASVKRGVEVCSSNAECPWSLEYRNV